jgi:hypothetical protein
VWGLFFSPPTHRCIHPNAADGLFTKPSVIIRFPSAIFRFLIVGLLACFGGGVKDHSGLGVWSKMM